NPAAFHGVLMRPGMGLKGIGRFSVIAPVDSDYSGQMIRYGLMDESAKLNLNMLAKLNLDDDTERNILMGLPEMTEYIADAILDWLDADDTPRQFGAESDYYLGLNPPYETKNGPLDALDELLLVSGVTSWLL